MSTGLPSQPICQAESRFGMSLQPERTIAAWRRLASAAVFAFLAGCSAVGAPPPVAGVAVPPVPPGMARVWFYRIDQPYVALGRPYVRMNGAIVGISEPGGAFYRDVAPGEYYVTVDSYGTDVDQFPEIAVVAGQTVYLQVIGSRYWASGGLSTEWTRPTYYVWLMQPQVGAAEAAGSPFYANAN
jgi:hypothetical protein